MILYCPSCKSDYDENDFTEEQWNDGNLDLICQDRDCFGAPLKELSYYIN